MSFFLTHSFNYFHKKQSGGRGEYAKVIGKLEPLPPELYSKTEFVDETVGTNVPKSFIPAIKKGFNNACENGGLLCGFKLAGIRFRLTDGGHHIVDSSELAFQTATNYAMKQALEEGQWGLIEPVMRVEIQAPAEYQGAVMGGISKRSAVMLNVDTAGGYFAMLCEVPLNNMFGYATELRTQTQGKGEFTMEFSKYCAIPPEISARMEAQYQKEREAAVNARK